MAGGLTPSERRRLWHVIAWSLLLFAALTWDIWSMGISYRLDLWTEAWVGEHLGDLRRHAVAFLSRPGDAAVATLALVAGAGAWWHRDRATALAMVAGALAGTATVMGLKEFFARPLPQAWPSHAYPSGHTMGATVDFGVALLLPILAARHLGLTLAWKPRMRWWAWGVVALATGTNRVVINVHWATDVVAGWLLSLAVLAGCALGLDAWHSWRARPAPDPAPPPAPAAEAGQAG